MPRTGNKFSKRYVFARAEIARIAADLGDTNPLHHDEAFARASRYGGIIASAGHSLGVLTSLIAEHYSKTHQVVGSSFDYRLRKGIPAGAETVLEWRVEAVEPTPKHAGEILILAGSIVGEAGTVYVTGKARVLVTPA